MHTTLYLRTVYSAPEPQGRADEMHSVYVENLIRHAVQCVQQRVNRRVDPRQGRYMR